MSRRGTSSMLWTLHISLDHCDGGPRGAVFPVGQGMGVSNFLRNRKGEKLHFKSPGNMQRTLLSDSYLSCKLLFSSGWHGNRREASLLVWWSADFGHVSVFRGRSLCMESIFILNSTIPVCHQSLVRVPSVQLETHLIDGEGLIGGDTLLYLQIHYLSVL